MRIGAWLAGLVIVALVGVTALLLADGRDRRAPAQPLLSERRSGTAAGDGAQAPIAASRPTNDAASEPATLTTGPDSASGRGATDRPGAQVTVSGTVTAASGRFVADPRLRVQLLTDVASAGADPVAIDLQGAAFEFRLSRPSLPAEVSPHVLELQVEADGHVPGLVWVAVPDSVARVAVEIQLVEGVAVHGVVVDESGAPVAGAVVDLTLDREADPETEVHVEPAGLAWASGVRRHEQHGRMPESVRRRRAARLDDATRDTTGAEGSFAFPPAPAGEASLRVSHDEHPTYLESDVRLESKLRSLARRIVLQTGATLRGRLTDGNGRPVVNTVVTAERQFERAARPGVLAALGRHQAIVGWGGEFEIHGLVPGDYEVRVEPNGYASTSRLVVLPSAEPLSIVLEESCSRLLQLAGDAPVQVGSEVVVALRAPPGTHPRVRRVETLMVEEARDASGVPILEIPDTGFELHSLGLRIDGAIETLVDAPACGETVTAILTHAGRLHGRVEDADGNALAGIGIQAVPISLDVEAFPDAPSVRGVRSDAHGAWSLQHSGPGAYRWSIRAEGWLLEDRVVRVDSAGDLDLGTVTLHPALTLEVDVVTPDGRPAPARHVVLSFGGLARPAGEFADPTAAVARHGAEARTDHAGRATFEGLPRGRGWVALGRAAERRPLIEADASPDERSRRVDAWAAGFDALARPFELGPDEAEVITLVAHPRPHVQGTTGDLGMFRALAGVAVIQPDPLSDSQCEIVEKLALEEDGSFSSGPLNPNPTLLSLELPGLGPIATTYRDLRLGAVVHHHFVPSGATLAIAVTEARTAEPVTGASVTITRAANASRGPLTPAELAEIPPAERDLAECVVTSGRPLGPTNAEGRLELPHLRRGEYYVRVTRDGYLDAQAYLSTRDWPEEAFQVLLERAARLEVTLIVDDGSVERFDVGLRESHASERASLGLVEGGEHRFGSLRPGAFIIDVGRRLPGGEYEQLDEARITILPDDEPTRVTLDARP